MEILEAAVLLNLVPDVGPLRFRNLCAHFGSAPRVFEACIEELESVPGISGVLARRIEAAPAQLGPALEQELEKARSGGISILLSQDEGYPDLLKALDSPPPVLYCLGEARVLKKTSLAVVGTRTPTPYGQRMAAQFSRDLARAGIVTVSGLARGVDTVAHESTLQARGRTVAVLGSGLLEIYPAENKRLAGAIAERGAVLSEFSLQARPEPGRFPMRNRIIAGLSLGTLVVEADEKSGALITARLAAEQGKDVFAVPGPLTSRLSAGPHRLIQQGAKLVATAEEILEEIAPLRGLFQENIKERRGANELPAITPEEARLLDLMGPEPLPIDLLSQRSRLRAGEFSETLLSLEMKGAVRSLPGKQYVRI